MQMWNFKTYLYVHHNRAILHVPMLVALYFLFGCYLDQIFRFILIKRIRKKCTLFCSLPANSWVKMFAYFLSTVNTVNLVFGF